MISRDRIDELLSRRTTVIGSDGEKIGTFGQLYLDDATSEPNWATVNTGLFGLSENFVPLIDASYANDEVHVHYTKEQVKDAPNIEPDGHLSEEEEERLYAYYAGLGVAPGFPEGGFGSPTPATERRDAARARMRRYVVTERRPEEPPLGL